MADRRALAVGAAWVVLALAVAATMGVPPAEASHSIPKVLALRFQTEEVRAGSPVQATITVRDLDEPKTISYLLQAPGGRNFPSTVCSKTSGNTTDHVVACQTQLPNNAPAGTYAVLSVNVTDKNNHFVQIVAGSPGLRAGPDIDLDVQVLEFIDQEPPVLEGVTIWPARVPRGASVRINVTASDPSGLESVSLGFEDAGAEATLGVAGCAGTGRRASCLMQVPRETTVGTHFIAWIEVVDTRSQARTYHRDTPGFRPGPGFEVELNVTLGFTDSSRPVLQAYRMPSEPVRRGDAVSVEIDAADNLAVTGMEATFESMHGGVTLAFTACTGLGERESKANCTAVVPATHPLGRSRIALVVLRDLSGNENRLPIAAPSESATTYAALLRQMTFTVLPPTLRTTGLSGEGLVAGLHPAVPEAARGRVVPIVIAEGERLLNASFRFSSGSGAILGVEDCTASLRPLPGGFECLMFVPNSAPLGSYRLDVLRVKTAAGWVTVDIDDPFAPLLDIVAAAEPDLPMLTATQERLVAGGITAAQANVPPRATHSPSMTTTSAPSRGSPGVPFVAVVGTLCLLAVALGRPERP